MWENWMFLENEYRNVLEIISGNFCWNDFGNDFGRILKKFLENIFGRIMKIMKIYFFNGKHF